MTLETWYYGKNGFCNLPVLSAQLITAPTGKPREILNFAPAVPPRPTKHNLNKKIKHTYTKPKK